MQPLALPTTNSLNRVTLTITDAWSPFVIGGGGIDSNPFGAIYSNGGGTDRSQASKNATTLAFTPSSGGSPATITITPGANTSITGASQRALNALAMKAGTPAPTPGDAGASPVKATVTSDAPQKPQPQTQQAAASDQSSPQDAGNVTLLPNGPYLIERHKVVHFLATGGAFVAYQPTDTFAAKQFPTTVLTNLVSTVTTTPAGGKSTTSTTNNTTVSTGNEYLPYLSGHSDWHPGAVAGITWFPGGLDTYSYTPRRNGNMSTGTFSKPSFKKLGVFLGSTVNTTGTFTFGPAYEFAPGVEMLLGGTLLSSDSLSLGVTSCHFIGTTLTSNTAQPSTVNTDVTDPASGTRTVTSSTTTITTETNCVNANATVLSDSTVPKQSNLHVGFTVGILLNSNLFKALSFGK